MIKLRLKKYGQFGNKVALFDHISLMIKLRLKKYGRKGQPCYRIVAMDSRVKRDGKSIEELGFYNPMTDETHLKFQRIVERLKQGAQPTETVRNIFVRAKIFDQL